MTAEYTKGRCPDCNSSDAYTTYHSDGHSYCFSCEYYEKGNSNSMYQETVNTDVSFKPYTGSYTGLSDRGITEKTTRLFGYQIAKIN